MGGDLENLQQLRLVTHLKEQQDPKAVVLMIMVMRVKEYRYIATEKDTSGSLQDIRNRPPSFPSQVRGWWGCKKHASVSKNEKLQYLYKFSLHRKPT